MDKKQKINKSENIKVVTANDFITADYLPKLSLNARKMLYIAIAQCRKDDAEFYEYETTPAELAEIWGIARESVYNIADAVTDELMRIIIAKRSSKGRKFSKRHLFEICEYDESAKVIFKLHKDMADLLLGQNRNFSKPLLWDFMKMRSPYSMAIWHLMQEKMHSTKPDPNAPPQVFRITLEEMRKVTGTEEKLVQISAFKERVLDKALDEIRKNCLVDIQYKDIKSGRRIVAFEFIAENMFSARKAKEMSSALYQRMRRAELIGKYAAGTITTAEMEEYMNLAMRADFAPEELPDPIDLEVEGQLSFSEDGQVVQKARESKKRK